MNTAGPAPLVRNAIQWGGALLLALLLTLGLGMATATAATDHDGKTVASIQQTEEEESPYSFQGSMRDSDREPIVGVEVTVTDESGFSKRARRTRAASGASGFRPRAPTR